ncbi:histone acetyltransferases subunit 3-domain-containing protein [Cokeromyces recurvatus]|uniref:histone acetyltransferases subunit 3-domain-containing protein n=1 Tax=Cokeromyces recurvatus TaxID=90255 RepID=UPI00221FB3F7|nr:histone acetyltransferases subunit 3-domain-containing protein [Cokeromyces recurvatus]KAI7903698.1 histone acetyltransferases subunit 3-domain-containing protein [Cokeromyces recurvatus]
MTSIARAHHQNKEVDFVRVKPKDQVPITTFWSTLEPYFRNLTEEDRNFLLQKSDQGKPYLIPPLGRHYLEKWAEEEEELSLKITTKPMQHEERPAEEGSSLTERLISSLVIENIMDYEQLNEDEDEEIGDENRITPIDPMIEKKYNAKTVVEMSIDPTEEIVSFEERLKRELRYAGLFGDEDVDWNAKEDDEICAELRALGHEYKEQVKINEYRKKRLLEVVDCQLQYEQYRQVLDTLDSQVEQGYLKRFRPQKSKKRKSTGPKATLSENTLYVMEKRKTWINALSHIFKDKNMTMPSSSIYDLLPEDDNNTSI